MPSEDSAILPSWDALGFRKYLLILGLSIVYLGAATLPLSSGLAFQAYLFWPAAAVSHTALFILGGRAWWGIALGSLILNGTGWLPWPHALAMVACQTLEPLVAWRIMVRLGCPHPDLRRYQDLARWLTVALLVNAVFSAGFGNWVVGSALPAGHFEHPLATGFSWFLGDLTAILCLGPALLHFLPVWLTPAARPPASQPAPSLRALATVTGLCLALLFAGRINPGLSRDVRLGLQFALVLPVLWMALRFGPRYTAAGVALLSLAFLGQLWTMGHVLPDEAFRFSQLHLLVLALAAFVSSAAAEEARLARLALVTRDLQAQRMEAVGTLAGGLVHEFNNQLTVVLGNLDRLRSHLASDEEAPDLAWRLEEAALAMVSTVQQLKALSHQVPLQSHPLPIREALIPFLATTHDLPGRIAFRLDLAENPVVGLEPELLTQALQRLLANSVQAIPGQGHITLKVWREDAWVHLALEDDGLGMSPEVLQRACDPFYTTKPQATSRGLGLSIAFALARQLGGQLLLDSHPGRGTRAEFVLPLASPDPVQGGATPAAPRTGRILLADDETGIRELAREFLQEEGFLVLEATDGKEALDAFMADPEGWDLVILDLVMPRLGGAEALNRIQTVRPDLPVLLMSGYSTDTRSGLLDGPHRGFLAKPFRLQELRQALQDLGLSPPAEGLLHGE